MQLGYNSQLKSNIVFSGLKVRQGEQAAAELGDVIVPWRYECAFRDSKEMRSAGRKYNIELSAATPYGGGVFFAPLSDTIRALSANARDSYNPIVLTLAITKNSLCDRVKNLLGMAKPKTHRMVFEPSDDYKVYWDFKGLRRSDIDAFVQKQEAKAP